MIPRQRGDVRNSVVVLCRLASSREMFVFLCNSTRVLSRPSDSGETPEMKSYTAKILSLRTTLHFLTRNVMIMFNLMLCSTNKVYRGPCLFMG